MIVIATLSVLLTWWLCLPWWTPLAAVWAWWAILLPIFTWRDFLAGMNIVRVDRGGRVTLPTALDELGTEPDAEHVIKYLLWPGGMAHNFMLNLIHASIYFRDLPRWGEWGLSMRLVRYVNGAPGWRRDRALSLRKRWLNRYDPRGVHTL